MSVNPLFPCYDLTRTWLQMTRPVAPEEATTLSRAREGVTIRRVASHDNGVPVADVEGVYTLAEYRVAETEYDANRAKILATRVRLTDGLRALGFEVLPSHANFVWATRGDRPVEGARRPVERAAPWA